MSIGESETISSKSVKLLGVHIDNRLKFDQHINLICKKANQKLHALARVSSYIVISKKKVLFNAFFFSQFSYCPLTWMCHSREQNAKINRLIYNDKKFSFQEMLDRDKSVNIHHKNLQQLSIEMFKVVKGLSPEIFSNLFSEKESSGYNLRSNDGFIVPQTNTVYNGEETISVLGPKIWNALPEDLRTEETLPSFKSGLKNINF